MALETGSYISDLVVTNAAPNDPKSQGDDHIRLIKYALRQSFPLIAGPVPIAHDQFASKDYVNQTAFSTALPAQPGGTLQYQFVSQNGAGSWKRSDIFSDSERLAQAQAIALYF